MPNLLITNLPRILAVMLGLGMLLIFCMWGAATNDDITVWWSSNIWKIVVFIVYLGLTALGAVFAYKLLRGQFDAPPEAVQPSDLYWGRALGVVVVFIMFWFYYETLFALLEYIWLLGSNQTNAAISLWKRLIRPSEILGWSVLFSQLKTACWIAIPAFIGWAGWQLLSMPINERLEPENDANAPAAPASPAVSP